MKMFNLFQRKLCWSIVFGAGLIILLPPAQGEERYPGETSRTMERGGPVTKVPTYGQPKKSEGDAQERPRNTVGEDMQGTGSNTVKDTGTATDVGGGGTGGTVKDGKAIEKSPTFQEVDKNGDHYVTKDELKDDPFLLKHFDMVDAGKDGKLEEHEYANLVAEKRRERGQ
jgi:hypothetical protein